jgi:hypothetical protein
MFNWNRERAPVAKVASIPTLSLEETKQVSGASFLLVERRAGRLSAGRTVEATAGEFPAGRVIPRPQVVPAGPRQRAFVFLGPHRGAPFGPRPIQPSPLSLARP